MKLNLQISARLTEILRLSLVAAGIFLRLYQYFSARSFWADEASLALNLVERDFAQLTLPLDYQQGAPIGFLFIEKFFMLLLGDNEFVLRLFPLAAGILALFLMARITREHLGVSGLFALAVFAFGWDSIYYSSELKQYSSDAAAVLFLLILALPLLKGEGTARDAVVLGIAGSLILWVSHPSFFALAAIGLALLVEKALCRNSIPLGRLAALAAVWLASFGVQYVVSLRRLAADEFLRNYWSKAFMPLPPWENKAWFFNTYLSMMDLAVSTEDAAIYLIPFLAAAGAVSLLIRRRGLGLTLLFLPLMALTASALQTYPLKGRFMLFLAPPFLLILSEGLGRVYSFVSKWSRPLALVLSLLPALWLSFFPARVSFQEMQVWRRNAGLRPVIACLAAKRTPGDFIYVYQSAEPSFRYYAPLFGVETEGKDVLVAKSVPQKKRALDGFFKDLDSLSGRVWFVFADIVDCGGCEGDPQAFYVAELDARGIPLDHCGGIEANAYLYKLP